MTERQEFVVFARQEGTSITALCEAYGISRKTGYKWLARADAGDHALANQSRRPRSSPAQTPPAMEARILELRAAHPRWGGRKLHHRLRASGVADVPAPSTITAILRRHGLLRPDPPARDFIRFEHPAPNALWQMDFMGHRPLGQGRVHPLTLLDDHSRFALSVTACANEQHGTVKDHLTAALPLWVAAGHSHRQRVALGHRRDGRTDHPGGVVAAPRGRTLAWPDPPSPDPRQGRTLPRHPRHRRLRPPPRR